MAIPVYSFKEATEEYPNNPFPPEIAEDPNILYHGTSSINEETIERDGIQINTSIFSKKEIEEVLTLFESVKWPYKRFSSQSNLKNYSLNHDFKYENLKPVYLGECVDKVSLYASKEFAGGEIAAQIRRVFKELNKLIKDPKELEDEIKRIQRELPFTGKAVEDFDLDLGALISKLDSLKHYQAKASQTYEDYTHGVIYAIKLDEKEEDFLEYSLEGGMGIKCFSTIKPKSLIAKTLVPSDYVHNFDHCVDYFDLPCAKKDGILYRIKNDRGISLESLDIG